MAHDSTREEAHLTLKLNSDPDVMPLWDDLLGVTMVSLREAVALTCNLDEDQFAQMLPLDSIELVLLDKRLENARRNVGLGFHLKTRQSEDGPVQEVLLAEFAAWVVNQGTGNPLWKDLPDEFRKLATVDPRNDTGKDAPPDTKEWKNLLKIIFGLAKNLTNIDLKHLWTTAGHIENYTRKTGYEVKQQTVYRFLSMAEQVLKDEILPEDRKTPKGSNG